MVPRIRLILLTNAAAGSFGPRVHSVEQQILTAFQETGAEVDLRPTPGKNLAAAARQACLEEPDAVVAAGGDGTVSSVAGALAETTIPLGVLPLGTLNHFARDLGIPPNLRAAARSIVNGPVRNVDIAEVNGHRFINNSSIGLYPHIVLHRTEQCQRLGRGKWLATALAALSILRRYPLISVGIETDGCTLQRRTPFVFIGNNPYHMNLLAMGARPRLDGGQLSIYSTTRTGRFGLLGLMARGLFGRLDQARDFDDIVSRRIRVETRRHVLRVACDGEVREMKPPLDYHILPGALKVIGPY